MCPFLLLRTLSLCVWVFDQQRYFSQRFIIQREHRAHRIQDRGDASQQAGPSERLLDFVVDPIGPTLPKGSGGKGVSISRIGWWVGRGVSKSRIGWGGLGQIKAKRVWVGR